MTDSDARPSRGYLLPEDRSEFGRWLLGVMGAMSFEQLAEEMTKRGHKHTASYYIAMSGRSKKPGRVIRAALHEFFGAPETAESKPIGDQAALVRAINDLVEELRETRREQAEWNKGVQDVVKALADRARLLPIDDREREPLEVAQQ